MLEALADRILAQRGDRELARLSPNLDLTFKIKCESESFVFKIKNSEISYENLTEIPDATFTFSGAALAQMMQKPPPVGYSSFTALQLASGALQVEGEKLPQARAALELIFERALAVPAHPAKPRARDLSQVSGRYYELAGTAVFCDRAGDSQKPALVFLHTAGADARQFQDLMADRALQAAYDLYAPDLPFHGRSLPPLSWDGGDYSLPQARYMAWVSAFLRDVVQRPVILAGCSMGAALALQMAAEQPELLCGVIAIEAPFQAKGRITAAQHDVGVHAGLHNPAWVRGLMSPLAPEERRRRAAWIYSQAAPQVYQEDLRYYTEGFDGALTAPQINCARTPVVVMSGGYDYSGSPEDGAKLCALMPGASQILMPELGHFPMTEHPDLFTPYFETALERLSQPAPARERISNGADQTA